MPSCSKHGYHWQKQCPSCRKERTQQKELSRGRSNSSGKQPTIMESFARVDATKRKREPSTTNSVSGGNGVSVIDLTDDGESKDLPVSKARRTNLHPSPSSAQESQDKSGKEKDKEESSKLIILLDDEDEPQAPDLSHIRDVLEDPEAWLTDDVINHVVANHLEPLIGNNHEFQYLPPSLTRAAALSPQVLSTLHRTGSVVIVPVNLDDLHWSVLVYFVQFNICIHYDSLRGHNQAFAGHLFRKLRSTSFISSSCNFISTQDLIQLDGYNCGVFMLQVIELIIHANGARPKPHEVKAITGLSCKLKRARWLEQLPDTVHFGGASSSLGSSKHLRGSQQQALVDLLWFGLLRSSRTIPQDKTATDILTQKLFKAFEQGMPDDPGKVLREGFRDLTLAGLKALFHAFKRCPAVLLPTYDRFIADYDRLYQAYRQTKQLHRKSLGIVKPGKQRSHWPSLQHDLEGKSTQGTSSSSKPYYTNHPGAWRHLQLGADTSQDGTGDLRGWLHTLVDLSLWRKIFSNTYASGWKQQGVAHVLELETPFGQVLVHNVKYRSGGGTTRLLLRLTNTYVSPKVPEHTPKTYLNGVRAPTAFLDASYSDELKLVGALKAACHLTDAQVAALMLAMMDPHRPQQPDPQLLATEVTAGGVTVATESESWGDVSDSGRLLRAGRSLAQESRKGVTITCPAGLILIYLCSHFFLLEPRHALPLFLGNLHALALVEAGLLTFHDLLAKLDQHGLGEEGSLLPSYNFGEQWRTIRLPLLHVSGYYDTEPDQLEYTPGHSLVVSTRALLARQRDEDEGALFALHKVLFMHFLCWMYGVDVDDLLTPLWE